MRVSKSIRLGFLSILSTLALFVGLFAFTGTASAHTAHASIDPSITIESAESIGGGCVALQVFGTGFSPSHNGHTRHAEFKAFGRFGDDLEVDPNRVRINHEGEFNVDLTVCGFDQFSPCDFEFGFGGCNPCDFGFFDGCNPCEFQGILCQPCPNSIFGCPVPCTSSVNNCFPCTNFSDCPPFFFHRHHRIRFHLVAIDLHTGEESNTPVVSIGQFFF